MPLWLVRASWRDDEAEVTQRWEVNAPSETAALREVEMMLARRAESIDAKLLPDDAAPDLAPGEVRQLS